MHLILFGTYHIIFLLSLLKTCVCNYETCDRRPLGTNTEPLPPDNRFMIDVIGLREDKYIPKTEYTVRLFSRDSVSAFIAFSIFLREDTTENKNNPRKPMLLKAGKLEPLPDSNNSKLLTTCNNTVIQSDITPKTLVEAKWTAPDKDNKCVSIIAVVAVKPDVWYSYEGPHSKRICEDRRKADDMQPIENENCQLCEDARYQLTFEGMWSYNTHPAMFPKAKDLARFSDVVGASHSKDFTLFKFNSDASGGLKLLAEQGNTTNLEIEIYEQLGVEVRTIIKATAPPRPNMKTLSTFRASRKHHMVSLATAIVPSPDWFLGVANLELCDAATNTWANNVTLNLYPLDAGTDSGKDFDSSNDATSPPQAISSAVIATNIPKEQVKPFARLLFHLVRTYYNPNCSDEMPATEDTGGIEDRGPDHEISATHKYNIFKHTLAGDRVDGGQGGGGGEDEPPPPPTTTTSEEPPAIDPNSSPECPMTSWDEWQSCEGECINNKLNGYQIRFRSHIGDPAPECAAKSLTDSQDCEEECIEEAQEQDDEEEQEE